MSFGRFACMIFGTPPIDPVSSKMTAIGVEFGCSFESRASRILLWMLSVSWTPALTLPARMSASYAKVALPLAARSATRSR